MAKTAEIIVTERLISRMGDRMVCQRPDCGRKFKAGDKVVRSSGNLYYCCNHYTTTSVQKEIDDYV